MAREKDMLETEVESFLRKSVMKEGGLCLKFIPDFARGFPDRLILLPGGVVCFVETKRPVGGILSSAQNVMHVTLRRLGVRVEVAWTKEQAALLVSDLVREE